MTFGITAKLFLAVLLPCMVVALAMVSAIRTSFSDGFLGYLNEQEVQRIESLQPSLQRAYAENGNWEFLRENPRGWFRLIRPPGMPGPEEPDEIRRAYQRPESDLTGVNLRLSLLDQNRNLIIGNPNLGADAILKPIDFQNTTVGWIALVPFQQVTTGAASRFHQQQMASSWIIGIATVCLAGLVSLLLARTLLAPVKRIAAATRRLAQGEYDARADVASRDEVGQLAADFNHLALVLSKNEALRRNFMADVSHELRTPIAVLKAELEAAEDGVRPFTADTIRSLQTEVTHLNKLVNDLYDLSLADAGALTYRKVAIDVHAVLEDTVQSFLPRLAEKSIVLDMPEDLPPVICEADPQRLQQLFANLLENTLRYTDQGGRLKLRSQVSAESLFLSFEDSAPGVPDEAIARLFERFYRVEGSRSRATGGAGLGLAICRNIVEAHDGSISAQHASLGGVLLTVTLPLMIAGANNARP